jgi:6-phosphogluconolactonase/glucosamine-6-phosphate isomerase/deaminase
MTFEHLGSTDEAAQILSDRLAMELKEDKRVLWLVPGGSNIGIAIKTMELIKSGDIRKLTMMLTDERYGEIGHADSNFQQLKAAGFMAGKAVFIQTLSNSSLQDTVRYYGEAAEKAFAQHDILIGQFGIGDDGHIAGILPGTPATMLDDDWAIGYESPPYTRITLTPHALNQVHTAYAFVFGESKRPALTRLRDEMLPIDEQPSQILKNLPEATVYSDQY